MSTHPPIANKVVMIDFDGTIVPWGPVDEIRPAFTGVKESIGRMRDAGYSIGIFTSRLSPKWHASAGTTVEEQRDIVARTLVLSGIPFDFITCEKVPAEAYFDDMAIHVEPGMLSVILDEWHENQYAGL